MGAAVQQYKFFKKQERKKRQAAPKKYEDLPESELVLLVWLPGVAEDNGSFMLPPRECTSLCPVTMESTSESFLPTLSVSVSALETSAEEELTLLFEHLPKHIHDQNNCSHILSVKFW